MLKVLIVEGNVKELRDKTQKMGLLSQSNLFENVLNSLASDLECTIAYPTEDGSLLPSREELVLFDGIVWTGSALNIYNRSPSVIRQIDFMKKLFEEDVKIFGSCWGLQVAVVAAGGDVSANDKGREIGIARDINVTNEGKGHPLYIGKPEKFDAVAIHLDHVVKLPEGSTILSENGISSVQGIEIKKGKSIFWGVQYHPEFDLEYIAGLINRYSNTIIEEGICADEKSVKAWANDFVEIHYGKGGGTLVKKYALSEDVLMSNCRLKELSNWLSFLRAGSGESK